MKLFICGSRTITDKDWIYSKIENCITQDYSNITILEGGAKGVDSIAKQWASEHNIPVIEYPPDYEKYHNEACHKRNEAMAADCDFMLALWTGESTGSLILLLCLLLVRCWINIEKSFYYCIVDDI